MAKAKTRNQPDKAAIFRFYAELNDFLPRPAASRRVYSFSGKPSVKDAIEAQGPPHPEVYLILANRSFVGFNYHLRDGDDIAVYPVFKTLAVASSVRGPEPVPEELGFALDVHLGKLARRLRLLGIDAAYANDWDDREIADIAKKEGRAVLTCDRRLLFRKEIEIGYWVRARDPEQQIGEVIQRFCLARNLRPFRRCLDCNGIIRPVPKAAVQDQLAPKTRLYYNEFRRCKQCGKIFWKGSHYKKMAEKLKCGTHQIR